MTYSDLLDIISREVLDEDVWPTTGTARENDQLNLAYIAVLAVGTKVPLNRLQSVTTSLTVSNYNPNIIQGSLPANLFTERQDLGIVYINIDGVIRSVSEEMSFTSLNFASENPLQQGNKLFHIDRYGKDIYANGAQSLSVKHVPVFPVATINGTIPLIGKDAQRAAHIVASHVTGSRARDTAASQFNQLLNQFYTE